MTIRIVTDSTCNLPAETIAQYRVHDEKSEQQNGQVDYTYVI